MRRSSSPLRTLFCAGLFGLTPTLCFAQVNKYLGQVFMMAGDYCPVGSAQLEGQTFQVSKNPALYSLFGQLYSSKCEGETKPVASGCAAGTFGPGSVATANATAPMPDFKSELPGAEGVIFCMITDGPYPPPS